MSGEHDYRIPQGSPWSGMWKVPAALAAVGLVMLVIFGMSDVSRLGYSYLFALFTGLTFVLGATFLVLIQFMAVGHWGITARRIVEVIMSAAPLLAVLAVPFFVGVATGTFDLYDEWMSSHDAHGAEHGDHGGGVGDDHGANDGHGHSSLLGASVAHAKDSADAAHDATEEHAHTPQEAALHHEVLGKKAWYLNAGGWFVRAIVYFAIWCLIAIGYFRTSRRQDDDKDPAHTVKMQSWSALGLVAFGLTLTFAAFDWLMALEPAWYSTIFGVVVFAASAVAILAATALIGMSLFRHKLTGDAINHEHFHDIGKLLFGFICFWTYVQFSQWMLIWYAGIPEEATWYHRRWEGGWAAVSLLLIFGHFVAPFLLLISRLQKRALGWLRIMCMWILAMHVVDIYWFVLPQAGFLSPSGSDIGALLFVVGTLFTYVFWQLTRVPLLPIGDPRLARSLHHHQSH